MYRLLLGLRTQLRPVLVVVNVLSAAVVVLGAAYFWPLSSAEYSLVGGVTGLAVALTVCLPLLMEAGLHAARRGQLRRIDQRQLRRGTDAKSLKALLPETTVLGPGRITMDRPIGRRYFYRTPATDTDLYVISEINARRFEGTPFAGVFRDKLKRNLRMWKRLGESFLIVDSPFADAAEYARYGKFPLYFSCVFPMTYAGFDEYFLHRKAGDAKFDPTWIATRPEDARAILVFTAAKNDGLSDLPGLRSASMAMECLRATAYHLQSIRDRFFVGQSAVVYIQNKDPGFRRLLPRLGFELIEGMRTYDNESVYRLTIVSQADLAFVVP